MQDVYLFVYGTLKKGFVNNYFLDDTTFISTAITCDKYQMYSCIGNAYPFLIKSERNHQIVGEVFKINSQKILASLDELEDYPDLYIKEFIKVELENKMVIDALVYLKNEDTNGDAIDLTKPIIKW